MSRKKKVNSDARGCLFLIFGTLCIIVGMFLYVLTVSRLTSVCMENRYAGQAVYGIMTFQLPSIIVAFILMDAILILKYLPNEDDFKKDSFTTPLRGKKTVLGKKKNVNIICIGILGLIVLCGVMSVNTYTLVTENGIYKHFFFDTDSHEWDEVTSVKIDCDTDKGLSVTFTMKDGNRYEILRGTISDTKTFAENQQSTVKFARRLIDKMDENKIPVNIAHMERTVKFYKNAYPELWPDVKAMIRYEEIIPNQDEEVPTEPFREIINEGTTE